MFHILIFLLVVCFASDLNYTLKELGLAWKQRSTRRSMTSPIRVVVCRDAESTAVWQMSKSAWHHLLHKWFEIHGVGTFSLTMRMNLCLFLLLAKKCFFCSFRCIIPTKFTSTLTTPPDRQR